MFKSSPVLKPSPKSIPPASRFFFSRLLSCPMAREKNLAIRSIEPDPACVKRHRHSVATSHLPQIAGSGQEPGSRCAVAARYRDTRHCLSNRHIPLLEFAATHSKQSQLTFSNRHTFGCFHLPSYLRSCVFISGCNWISNRTRLRLEIAATHSKQTIEAISNRTFSHVHQVGFLRSSSPGRQVSPPTLRCHARWFSSTSCTSFTSFISSASHWLISTTAARKEPVDNDHPDLCLRSSSLQLIEIYGVISASPIAPLWHCPCMTEVGVCTLAVYSPAGAQ